MKIALFGASGFIGTHLKMALRYHDHELTLVTRDGFAKNDAAFCRDYINGQDAVINLSGAPLSGKWNEAYKKELFDSRINTTRKIAKAILEAAEPPSCLINASGVGIYNDKTKHTEESEGFADNFLARLCQSWEAEALQAESACRVVILRMGVVLAKDEGVLEKMAPPFKKGIGAQVGNGNQGVSWIHIDDLTEIFLFVLNHPEITGIINAVGEYPTDNYNLSASLGKMFGQPVYFSIPKFLLKLIYGEGSMLLIEGQKAVPDKLLKSGFVFQYVSVDKALFGIYKE
ncbi:MAG: TIGR01777 family protein [Bacteroidales bacterium]|nr:TIGR01777 family protein [Bacteroidales bacterium]